MKDTTAEHLAKAIFAKQRLEEWTPLTENLETIQDAQERIAFLIDFVLSELETRSDWLRFLYMLYLSTEGIQAIQEAMKKYKKSFHRLFHNRTAFWDVKVK